MPGCVKRIFVTVIVIMVLLFPVGAGFPNPDEIGLRWKNGDVLPGQLLESSAGTIRWSSPYFLDDLILDVKVLDGVAFWKQDSPPVTEDGQVSTTEAFRVNTLSGDAWIADLIDSDDETFLFSSKRHGQFRVKRSAVYMLERQERPDFLFDGSQLKNWKLPKPKREAVDPALPFDFVRRSDWFAAPEGHPKTWIDKADIFYAFNWPEHFEIELELASDTHSPNFSFAFGKDLYQALRLETWKDELVAVQGVLFKSVLAIPPEQRSIRLRLTYHEGTGVLRVFDATGNLLLELKGIEPTVKDAGIYVQNRGEDLTVRNVRVYRQLKVPAAERINLSKPHVYMTNGERIQGRLFVQEDGAYVLSTDGTRRGIDLQKLNHILQPGILLAKLDQAVTLKYPDKVVLHGELMQVKSDSVVLQTAFADEPVTCSLSDAALLQFPAKPDMSEAEKDKNKLILASGDLRGRVVFGGGQGTSSVQWESVGALKPVRLAYNRAYRIERNDKSATGGTRLPVGTRLPRPYSTAQFRHTLHLKSGEIFPGQITAYDGKSANFQSPFISAQHLDSVDIKALEFSGRTHAPSTDRTQPIPNFYSLRTALAVREPEVAGVEVQFIRQREGDVNVKFRIDADDLKELNEGRLVVIVNEGNRGQKWVEIENRGGKNVGALPGDEWLGLLATPLAPEKDKSHLKLERALTVPRASRDNPPSHLLVAKTGDMKRGTLLDFRGQTIQFDSRLRESSIPIDRVARVVNISESAISDKRLLIKSEPSSTDSRKLIADSHSQPVVRVTLTDGSILIFEPLEVQDSRLLGRSSIYGEVSVPVDSIRSLHFGAEAKSFKAAFEEWTVRPAKEPEYDD